VDILPLDQLLLPDERTLRFASRGFLTSAKLTPESAAELQQRSVAGADLVDAVPADVRASFERLRRCHSLGVIWYEAFTVAADLSHVVLEFALRERFIEFYASAVPLVSKDSSTQVLNVRSFDELAEVIGGRRKNPPQLLTRRDGSRMRLPLTLNPLLVWARHEGLLDGQRNRHVEAVLAKIRNEFAHGGYRTGMPGDSARGIRDLAEIVNRLWGHSTPGGRLHPAPLTREAVVIGWRDQDAATQYLRFPAEQLSWEGNDEDEDWTYVALLAVPNDESLLDFDSRFELTSYPADLLWGPGSLSAVREWWTSASHEPDAVRHLDRTFLVRVLDGVVQPPRSVAAAAALAPEQRAGTWHVVQADYPMDAWLHVSHAGQASEAGNRCSCSARSMSSGAWDEVLPDLPVAATAAGPSCRPGHVRLPRFGDVGSSSDAPDTSCRD
jgi:hypothetical protein